MAAWRDQLRSLLKTRPEWHVIAEACDGQEAIEKASEMQPDIILLDVGMPSLNGIEAAKIIRQRCPRSRIVFVTQEGDVDVRSEAMRVGAAGRLEALRPDLILFSRVGQSMADQPSTQNRTGVEICGF